MRGTKRVNRYLEKSLGIRVQRNQSGRLHINSRFSKAFADAGRELTGLVERFDEQEVVGWISGSQDHFPVKVSVCVNNYPVISTWANVDVPLSSTGSARSFFLGIRGLWKYCKQDDHLTIRANGKLLPISEIGSYISPAKDGESSLDVLTHKLANGYVFTRSGNLQLSMKLDTNRQKQMINLYKETSKILKREYNTTPFLIYGSLLGQVREGGFIGHDDDFDIAYVSKYRKGPEVANELVEIAKVLQNNGMTVELRATAVHIHSKENPRLRIDLFHLYFNEDDELTFSFGVAGTKHFMKSDWNGLAKVNFAGHTVTVPKNTKKLVECIYGESWRTPIAGFSWNHARTRRDKTSKVPVKVREEFNGSTSQ